jgi:hypothetical protein
MRGVVKVFDVVSEADEDVDAAQGQHEGAGDWLGGWPVAAWLDVEAGVISD